MVAVLPALTWHADAKSTAVAGSAKARMKESPSAGMVGRSVGRKLVFGSGTQVTTAVRVAGRMSIH